jgi:oligopeptidase B
VSFPEKIGNYFYYSRCSEDDNFFMYCRSPTFPDISSEEVRCLDSSPPTTENRISFSLFSFCRKILFDQNSEGEKHPYIGLGFLKISPDERFLAYTLDTTGDETYHIFVKELATGNIVFEVTQ